MTTNTKMCVAEDSCATAGKIMARRRCGFVPIVDSLKTRRVVGVVTARDIMRCLVRHDQPASRVAVKTCMTRAPETISSEAALEEAMRVMREAALRRMPVVDRGKLVGVLSLEDITLAAHQQWAYVGPHVTERHVTEILEAIAAARENHQGSSRRR
jgi:CBS domain-containing protein